MRPISFIVFLFVFVFWTIKAQDNSNIKTKLGSLMMRINGIESMLSLDESERKKEETQRQKEVSKQKEEDQFRQIVNERLMPLTRGNKFMRDFYSGRY